MKRVLILTVTAGNGHNYCAKTMKEKLEISGECEVKIIDMLKEYSTSLNVWLADGGYNFAISCMPKSYEAFFNMYQRSAPYKRFKCKGQFLPISTASGLLKEIYEFKPDVIYCTHFYGAIAMTDLKLAYHIPAKVITPVLDYENSPFWEAGIGIDYLILPNEDFIYEFKREGFKKEQLICAGIPVKETFSEFISKEEARKKLRLYKDLFTVMVMFGGGHFGSSFKVVKNLIKCVQDENIQIIVINGYNKKDYERVKKLKVPNNIKIENIAYTDQVDLYMSASDVCISKMGGLSATEMLNKKLPMLITSKVAGQEKYNLQYLMSKGVAKSFKNRRELSYHLHAIMKDKDSYKMIKDKMDKLRKNGTAKISQLILSQDNAIYDEEYISTIEYSEVKKNIKRALKTAHKESVKQFKLNKC